MPAVDRYLGELLRREGSDLHLIAGAPPRVRVQGSLEEMDFPALQSADVERLAVEFLGPKHEKG